MTDRRSPVGNRRPAMRPRVSAALPMRRPGRTPIGSDMLSIGALSSAAQGASYYERDGYYARDDPEHMAASAWAGRGAGELGLKGPVDPETFRAVLEGKVPDGSGQQLGRRAKDGEILHRPGRDLTFSAPEIRLHRRAGRRRRPRRRGARPRRGSDPGLGREERRRDKDEGPGDRENGADGQPEDRRRHLPPRHLAQPRPAAAYPLRNRQHGAGGGRQVALDGQRGALRTPEAGRDALPQRAGRRPGEARLRYREDPCRRPLRDRGGVARSHRELFDPARRDRGGDERPGAGRDGGQSAPGGARGADDKGRETRHRPRGAERGLGETGDRSRLRRARAGCRGCRKRCRAGTGSRGGTGNRAGRDPATRGAGARRHRRCAATGRFCDGQTVGRGGSSAGIARGGGRDVGDGASLGARGRVRPRRSSWPPCWPMRRAA